MNEPLADPVLEIAAQLYLAGGVFCDIAQWRRYVVQHKTASRNLVAEARKQLRVDELREALQAFLDCPEISDCAPEDMDYETRALESSVRTLLAETEEK